MHRKKIFVRNFFKKTQSIKKEFLKKNFGVQEMKKKE